MLTNLMSLMEVAAALAAAGAIAAAVLAPPYLLWSSIRGEPNAAAGARPILTAGGAVSGLRRRARDAHRVSVILDRSPGELARASEVTGAAGMNICQVTAFAGKGRGVIKGLVDDDQVARDRRAAARRHRRSRRSPRS